MKKNVVSTILITIILASTFLIIPFSFSATEEEIEASIEAGIAYIAATQNSDGSWYSLGHEQQAARTGFALIKLQDYAYEKGYESPFHPDYKYSPNVTAGWDWVWTQTYNKTITTQALGNPDSNGNGEGVVFGWRDHRWVYTTGIMLMALEASGTPSHASGKDFNWDGVPDSFFDIAQDAVDWLSFAQGEYGHDEGGWYYSVNTSGAPTDNSLSTFIDTDNSNGGFAVLGLAAAEGFGCNVQQWVKNALSVWVDTLQDPVDGDGDDGGSWYRPGWTWVNSYKTGNLIFEMTLVGDSPTTPRFLDAMDYIERHWNDTGTGIYSTGWGYNTNPALYLSMYTLMKGFEYSSIDTVNLTGVGGPEYHDWYAEFAHVIVTQQNTYTGPGGETHGYWSGGAWGDDFLNTIWALLVLEKVSPPPPVVNVNIDIKPGSWPNPLNKDKKGVISIAICGTDSLDVSTIDPATVMLYNESLDVGVPPLRWSYEDAATPYDDTTPDDPDGHEATADGFVDLILKFDVPELVNALDLCKYEDWTPIKLYLKGNLVEDAGGTPIEGFDWVRIQSSKGKGKGKK